MRVLLATLLLVALPTAAEETLVLRESSIKAMEGLPAVTFVVPWQPSEAGSLLVMPDESVLDDYLQPLDSELLPAIAPSAVAVHETNNNR